MSGASNLGYGKMTPLGNVNGNYVNVTNSNNPANFGSNEIPGLPGLSGTKSNIDAAAGKTPGICLFKGGSRVFKGKIKNITKLYKKMRRGSRKVKSMKKRIFSRISRKMRRNRRKTKRNQRGGAQYQNNQPITPTYSVGGHLSASNLGLANPPPITRLPNCVNCTDNYNHFTGKGFASKGH
jgi:hypothetical protein